MSMLPKPRKEISPQWKPRWENLSNEQRIKFTQWVTELCAIIGMPLLDAQLVGSRAFGYAEGNSDYDIVFVPLESQEQRPVPENVISRIKEIEAENGIRIHAGIGPDARGLLCYSFGDAKFYGKELGEVVNKKSRYNSQTKAFQMMDAWQQS